MGQESVMQITITVTVVVWVLVARAGTIKETTEPTHTVLEPFWENDHSTSIGEVPLQMTPASLLCPQLWAAKPLLGHSFSRSSEPWHLTLS